MFATPFCLDLVFYFDPARYRARKRRRSLSHDLIRIRWSRYLAQRVCRAEQSRAEQETFLQIVFVASKGISRRDSPSLPPFSFSCDECRPFFPFRFSFRFPLSASFSSLPLSSLKVKLKLLDALAWLGFHGNLLFSSTRKKFGEKISSK